MRLITHEKLAGQRVLCDCGRLMSAKANSACGKCGNVWQGEIVAADAPKAKRPRKKAGLLEKNGGKRDAAKAKRKGAGTGINV